MTVLMQWRRPRPGRSSRVRLGGLALAFGALILTAACNGASNASTNEGDTFPSRALTIIAAGSPGGGLDTAARTLQSGLDAAGVTNKIDIENNGGGGGNPARAELLKKPNDGYTVVAESNRIFLNPLLGTTDMTVDQFTPIAQLSNDYLVWAVRADSEFTSAQDVLDAVKQDPKSVSFGVGTVPSDDQINVLMAAKQAGISDLKSLNIVAFQSGGDLNTELLGGHVQVVSTGFSEAAPLAESGKLRLLSISSAEPQPAAAGVPTWKEIGLNFTVSHWRGIFGPADMPDYAVQWWQDNIKQATETDTWKQDLGRINLTSDFLPADEFSKAVNEQKQQYQELLTAVGLVN